MRKKKHKKIKFLPSMTVSGIFILSVMGIVALTFFAFIIVFARMYRRAVEDNAVASASQNCRLAKNTVENYIDGVQEILIQLSDQTTSTSDEIDAYFREMVNLRSDVIAVTVSDEDGNILRFWNTAAEISDDAEPIAYLGGDEEIQEIFVTGPHVQTLFDGESDWVITVSKTLPDAGGQNLQINIDMPFSYITDYVDSIGIGTHGYVYVTDENDITIYNPREKNTDKKGKNISDSALRAGVYTDPQSIYAVENISGAGWKIVAVCFVDEMVNAKVAVAVTRLLCILAVLLVVIFLIGYGLSHLFSAPLRRLAGAMRDFEDDTDGFSFSPMSGTMEIEMLSDSFGHMVTRVQALVEQVKSEKASLRQSELRALQAQINPHFLYNTLDTIEWMCENGNTEDAAEMVNALAQLFRIGVSQGHELIPIRKEIEHAKSYLKIQSYRYKNRFTYRFDVENDCLDCLCTKITLQPIIENAIKHGIAPMVDDGELLIRIRSDGDDIIFEVADNGIGMSEEQSRSLLEEDNDGHSGIGIYNVNERIRIYFGDAYGLSIRSELDEGTLIAIRMPKITEEPSN
ncbi:MAG: histidine kinase [Clostridiales bacterium]|nr:histidine kinase [Clostridiales bacterium]